MGNGKSTISTPSSGIPTSTSTSTYTSATTSTTTSTTASSYTSLVGSVLPLSALEFADAIQKHRIGYDEFHKRMAYHAEQKRLEMDRKYQDEIFRSRLARERLEAELARGREIAKRKQTLAEHINLKWRFESLRDASLKWFAPRKDFELTEEMMIVINSAFIENPQNETLVEIDDAPIMRKDIHSLHGLNWLNDEVINAYMHLLVLRGRNEGRPKVYAFNTFFFPKLRDSGYNSIRRWTRKVDIFSFDFLLVPVHLGNHWCLAVIDFEQKKISYYDSLRGSDRGCCELLLNYLKSESNDKKKLDFDDENWQCDDTQLNQSVPRQDNYSDCGVFTCMYAEFITRPTNLKFGQKDMQMFRKKMVYEIVKKQIIT